jgi:hypothetical protein
MADRTSSSFSFPRTRRAASASVATFGPRCPDSSDYVGDATWAHELVVTSNAEYCGMFDEARTLEQEYPLKAIAALGGHLKHNGAPGWQTLARGCERLGAVLEGYLLRRELEAELAR